MAIEYALILSLGGVIGYIIRVLIEDRLARNRTKDEIQIADFRKSARDFRAKVNEALSLFQRIEDTWTTNNRNFRAMANFINVIDLAAKDFTEFLPGESKTRFMNKWQETKNYCSTTLPKSMTGGRSVATDEAKAIFLQHVNDLLKFAEQK